jgi:hypothetical protein
MAVITPSSIVSEIRGSVGDVTYSKNRYGPYVKAKLIQPASSTAPQVVMRDALADGVASWQLTTEATKQAWENFVVSHLKSKNISRHICKSAYNEFVSRYVNRILVEGSNTGFNPLPAAETFPVVTSITQAANSILIDWSSIIDPANTSFVIYATEPLNSTVQSIGKSQYKSLAYFQPSGLSGSEDIFTLYDALYSLTAGDVGKRIGIAIKAVNNSNYAGSTMFYTNFILSSNVISTPPSIVQNAYLEQSGSSLSKTVTFASAPAEDSLIVLMIACGISQNVTLPSGFTRLAPLPNAASFGHVCYKIAGASEPSSYTFTLTSATLTGVAGVEIINANTVTPFNETGGRTGNDSIANAVSTIDLNANTNSLALACLMTNNNNSFVSLSNSFTRLAGSGNALSQFAERTYTAPSATVNTVWDWTQVRNFRAFLATINPL